MLFLNIITDSTGALDEFDELIDIATLHFDDGFVIENIDPNHENTSTSNNSENQSYTKCGQIRKRKKYNSSPKTRIEKKTEFLLNILCYVGVNEINVETNVDKK